MQNVQLTSRMNDQEVTFNVFNTIQYPHEEVNFITGFVDNVVVKKEENYESKDPMKVCLVWLAFLDGIKQDFNLKPNNRLSSHQCISKLVLHKRR